MELTEFEKQFLIEAIAKEYRYRAECINEYSKSVEDYGDTMGVNTMKQLQNAISDFSLKIEQIKKLADKLDLDISFL